MNPILARPGRAFATAFVLMAACAVAGCGGNPSGNLLESAGLAPKMEPRPDFVASSRPATVDYIPIGTPQEGRPTAARSADEVKAAEAELDAVRAQNQAQGEAAAKLGGTPAPQPVTLPAAKAKSR